MSECPREQFSYINGSYFLVQLFTTFLELEALDSKPSWIL